MVRVMNEELVLLGKRIAYLREKYGFTQEKLAEKIHYSPNHISKLESARTNPSFDLLLKIANVFNIEVLELFDYKQQKLNLELMKNEIQSMLNVSNVHEIELLYKIYKAITK